MEKNWEIYTWKILKLQKIKNEKKVKIVKSLEKLDLSSFNTDYLTEIGNTSILRNNLDLFNYDTQNVIKMINMFFDCASLTNINLSSFNTQKV